MSKLYPPIIEETLPAFYSENGMVKITIPFSMNRAVSSAEVGGFELKIKTVQSGTLLYTLETYKPNDFSLSQDNLSVSFYINDTKQLLKVGQFYKLQLAYIYIDENTKNDFLNQYYNGSITIDEYAIALSERKKVGYYSGAAIAKYTTKPKLYINNLRAGFLNSYSNSYTGCYEQISSESEKKDSTEKVYYYKFDVYNSDGKSIFYTTDYKLHNTATDMNIDYSQDSFDLNQDIDYDSIYFVQYTVVTSNGLTLSTPKYKVVHRELIDAQINVDINTTLDVENGYVDIRLVNRINDSGLYDLTTGAFLLLRADEDTGYKQWFEMTRFILNGEAPSSKKIIFRDYTIEQGKKYQYAIQQYGDSGLYSNKIYSEIIQADFEYAFLYDGKRQLKIKYNPKMTKFTNTRLEQKIDTIGGKHPFIFRNGQVNYNEFPVGGLISYFMDEEQMFMSEEEFSAQDKTTNYTVDNIVQERTFKMKVLEWLNNGEPKIFRSPTEGNFIIRLLKVSLNPETKLGNLLHNFSGTAYEIADYNYQNLRNYNFIDAKAANDEVLNFATINLEDVAVGKKINKEKQILQTVRCDNMVPGEQILISFTNGTQEVVTIGVTGRYFVNRSIPIEAISIVPRFEEVSVKHPEEYKHYYIKTNEGYITAKNVESYGNYSRIVNENLQGLITYSYFTTVENTFGLIENVVMDDCSVEQFIGEHNILQDIRDFKYNDIYIKHPIKTVTGFYSMIVRPRPLQYCDYITNNTAVLLKKDSEEEIGNIVNLGLSHPFSLYNVGVGFGRVTPDEVYDSNFPYYQYDENNDVYYRETYANETVFKDVAATRGIYFKSKLYDYANLKYYKEHIDYEPFIWINGEKIYITHETEFDLSKYDNITELKSGNGVVVDIIYQTKSAIYTIESTSPVFDKKQVYLDAIQKCEEKMLEIVKKVIDGDLFDQDKDYYYYNPDDNTYIRVFFKNADEFQVNAKTGLIYYYDKNSTVTSLSAVQNIIQKPYQEYLQILTQELIKEGIITIEAEKEVSSL